VYFFASLSLKASVFICKLLIFVDFSWRKLENAPMKIGVPKEIKAHEHRVGMVPNSVKELVSRGHTVIVQSSAGDGIGVSDENYVSSGAQIVSTADEVFAQSELIVKVKEPQPEECKRLRSDQIIFTFLHLAADHQQSQLLMQSGVTAIAYETVTDSFGRLPLLAPMSEVAGRMAVQAGAHLLEKTQGGRGVLLGGVPGVAPAKVTVLGGGVVGANAIQIALGMGAEVTVLDNSIDRLRDLEKQFSYHLNTIYAVQAAIDEQIINSDLVIGAVLVPGASAPKLLTKEIVALMQPGSVIVDVAIDQGGCIETSRPTNFNAPTYIEYGVIHSCVTNLPGAVPRTSAFALNNATLPFIIEIADKGYKQACLDNRHLMDGLNICHGMVTHRSVAEAINQTYVPALKVLQG
jgi:alanine dehydrogenase